MTGKRLTSETTRRSGRGARLLAAVAATSLAAGLLSLVPPAPPVAAAPGEGLRFVGIIPDDQPNLGTDAEGAYFIDPVSRVAFQYYKGTSPQNTTRLLFRAMDIDRFVEGKAQPVGFNLAIDQQRVTALTQAFGTDITRTKIDIAGREPVVALDTKTGRLFYPAGGAMYEVNYDMAARTQTLAKWVAPPHTGRAVDENQLYTPSGATSPTGDETYQPSFGMAYDDAGASPIIYQVGQLNVKGSPDASLRGLWIAGWDARPGNPALSPELRQRWFYVSQTCRSVGRDQNTYIQSPIFRDGDWLYTFCDGSTDGSARGVLRVRIDPITGPIAGTEQFFPGVTGVDANVFADPAKARLYMLTLNSKAHARSVLVFDGRASNGQGAYIGAFSVATSDEAGRDPGPAMGGFNPVTSRWYFQSDNGAWLQEGSLRRVAQPERKVADVDGGSLKFVVRRPIRVDPATATRPTRIFVEQEAGFCGKYVPNLENCTAVYEDGLSSVGTQNTIAENTLNVPETPGLVGSYAGIGTAFGVRTRVLRGASTVWPGGVGNQTVEGDPAGNPASLTWYGTDPFFYHGGDCGAKDREVTVGRIFQTTLAGGLRGATASASALGADPDVHIPSAADDTQTRDDLGNPDPCTRYLAEQMMGPNCYSAGATPSDPATHKWVDLDGDGRHDNAEPYEDLNQNEQWDPGEPYTDLDGDGRYDRDENRCETDAAYFGVMEPFCKGFQSSQPQQYNQFVKAFGNQCAKRANLSPLGAEWPYRNSECRGDEAPPANVTGLDKTPMPTAVSVTCKAGAAQPTVSASTIAQTAPSPLSQFVSVGQVETSTELVRVPATATAPGDGLTVTSRSILRGINIANLVQIDEFVVVGTAHAEGYATADATTAEATATREFRGVRIGPTVVCAAECDTAKVLEQINGAISSYGYVRAASPEADFTEGTSKGTLAKLQKDLLQQDADRTMNRDFSTEWVGLEIAVYRDSQRRGTGRWIIALGGVYAQSQFTVIRGLGLNITPPRRSTTPSPVAPAAVQGAAVSAPFGVTPARPLDVEALPESTTPAAVAEFSGEGGLLEQIADGFRKSVKMALVLAGLWALVYGPVYLSRRRSLLKEIASR